MYDKHRFHFYHDKHGKPFTFKEAAETLVKINGELREKTFDPKEYLPGTIEARKFENAVDTWFEKRSEKVAPSTSDSDNSIKRTHFKYFNGMDLRDIKLKHLQTFYDRLPGSAKTKKNIMDLLHSFFRWARRWGEIDELPIWPEMEQIETRERFALTYEEQQEALKRLPAGHRAVIEFLMETGLRPGEVCALQVGDIDFKKRLALVRRTYSGSKLHEKTKGKKDKWIPLSDRACELIQTAAQNQIGFVFNNPVTKRGYRPEFIRRIWTGHSKTGVELYSATRHSFCTQLVEDGESLKTVQLLARHADLRSTQRYVHPTEQRSREAVNRRGRKVIEISKASGR
jgi:integrase